MGGGASYRTKSSVRANWHGVGPDRLVGQRCDCCLFRLTVCQVLGPTCTVIDVGLVIEIKETSVTSKDTLSDSV